MGFNFFKKDDGVPDVGQEEKFDSEKEKKEILKKKKAGEGAKGGKEEKDVFSSDSEGVSESSGNSKSGNSKLAGSNSNVSSKGFSEASKLEMDKIKARVESMGSLLKSYNERFTTINQQIGELRSSNLSNEKNISSVKKDSMKAIDIVKEVSPEKLRIDYQKASNKMNVLSEKIEANRQFMSTVIEEVKDLRKKAGIFVGTDALLKLNEEIKKDLVEVQKMSNRVRLNADKSEQLFIELRKGFAENQKLNEVFNNLDSSYSGLRKEMEKLRVDFSNIVKSKDFEDFKKRTQDRFSDMNGYFSHVEQMKEENERLAHLVETTLSVVKRNERDIADIAVSVGNENIKAVSEHENKFELILKLVDELASEVRDIKRGSGVKKKVVEKKDKSEENVEKKPVEKGKVKKDLESKESKKEGENLLGISDDLVNKWGGDKGSDEKKEVSGKKEVAGRGEVEKKPIEKKEVKSEKKSFGDRIDSIKGRIKKLINVEEDLKKIKKGREKKSENEDVKKIKNDLKDVKGEENVSLKEINDEVKDSKKTKEKTKKVKKKKKKKDKKKDKTRDKRLKALEKARKVHMEHVKHDKEIREKRLKNLAKARRARRKKKKGKKK